MTDQRLRELLEERVADVTPIDLVDGAWERASVVRRRRHAVAGTAVAVLAIVGTATVVVSGRGDDAPPPPTTSSTESPAPVPRAERSGKYGGVPVWWAPTSNQEEELPQLSGSGLPERIDLSETEGEVPTGMRAVGLFQLWGDQPGEVVVVGADGASYSLDVSRLEPVTDGGGLRPPVTQESLSSDGRYAFFVQQRSLEVYDFGQATWTTIPTRRAGYVEWSDDGASIRVPWASTSSPVVSLFSPDGEDLGTTHGYDFYGGPQDDDDFYGPIARHEGIGARGLNLAGPQTNPNGTEMLGVDALGAGGQDRPTALLAFPIEFDTGQRRLQCCPAVGWFDSGTVLFESRSEAARILAWRVGTRDVYRVSDIRGWTPGEESYVASFAAVDGSVSVDETDTRPIDYVTAERGPSYGGANIWWAPPAEDETGLPWLGTAPLPRVLDLSEGHPAVPSAVRAVGVFQLRDRAVVLADDGAFYALDVGHLDGVTDEAGNAIDSLGEVSPDGRHVFFVQRGGLEVYGLRAGRWSTIDTPDWLAEGARWFGTERIWVPAELGSANGTVYALDGETETATLTSNGEVWGAPGVQAVGSPIENDFFAPQPGAVAQDYVVSGPMTRPDGTSVSGASVLHVGWPGDPQGMALAIPILSGERSMGCCSAIGWWDQNELLYWSTSASSGLRILSWDVGSRWMTQVSEVAGVEPGERMTSSFADLS